VHHFTFSPYKQKTRREVRVGVQHLGQAVPALMPIPSDLIGGCGHTTTHGATVGIVEGHQRPSLKIV
jgi:hypothetical protein